MAEETLSSQIYLSRDSIRVQISNRAKTYLELENVDLAKSSFLSFMIDTLSTLTSNLLFYQLSSYREFFLVRAQLPESILNLASFLGYDTVEATAADANVLITIPFGFDDSDTQFTISDGFEFQSDGEITFRTTSSFFIEVLNNATVTVTMTDEDNRQYNLPVIITDEDFSFVIPLKQIEEVVQETQIDADLQEYQFTTVDIPISGQVSSLEVVITEPGSASSTTWTEFSSLFLMDETDNGYVSRRTDTGRRLSFGNGLIGVQPTAGSTVTTTTDVTEGADGNVIAGSIRTGDRIYLTTDAGITQIVNYTVINTSAAYNGEDEESLEEIRKNAIASIRSLERLVTEQDYEDISTIVTDAPIAQNSLPVLKRSDLQVNEIALFSGILFGTETEEVDQLVPMRNAVFTEAYGTSTIDRDTIITIGDYDYRTLFDLQLVELNSVGYYEYIIFEVELSPALETSYNVDYDIYADLLEVVRDGTEGIFRLHYKSTESDAAGTSCKMEIESSGSVKDMTTDSTGGYYIYTFDPYTDIPADEQTFNFTIYDPSDAAVAVYSNKVTFREDLRNYMRSNAVWNDSTSITVYDVPVILDSYYEGIDQSAFELEVMQALIGSLDLSDTRMLTDFTNIKFTNTYGNLESMLLNQPTISSVIDILEVEPSSCDVDDRYIIKSSDANACITGEGEHIDNIIRCIDSTGPVFTYEEPVGDTIVYVDNLATKYIYSDRGWIPLPTYNIPLVIEVEVTRESTYSGTLTAIIADVREALYDGFSDRFGTNAEIYRSEIIDIVQEVDGVSHCRLRQPETSIFFNFELTDLTESELLSYGPEYVYFKEENVSVKVI
jgi:hypothetical protein